MRIDFPMQPGAVPRNGLHGLSLKAPTASWPPLQQAQPMPGGPMLPRPHLVSRSSKALFVLQSLTVMVYMKSLTK